MVALPRPRSATAGILRQVGGFDQPGLEVSKDIHTIMRTRDPRMWKVSMSDLSDFTRANTLGAAKHVPEPVRLEIPVESVQQLWKALTQIEVAAELGLHVLAKADTFGEAEAVRGLRGILAAAVNCIADAATPRSK